MRDRSGSVWVGTDGGGLFQLEWHSASIGHLPGASVHALHEDRAGALWVGTSRGLTRLERRTQTPAYHRPRMVCRVTSCSASLEDAGRQRSVDRHRQRTQPSHRGRGTFTAYTGKHGLFEERVQPHLRRPSRQPLADLRGRCVPGAQGRPLTSWTPERSRKSASPRYGIADGLPSTECAGNRQPAGWAAPDGRMFIPTLRGVAILDPGWTGPPPAKMPIRIAAAW